MSRRRSRDEDEVTDDESPASSQGSKRRRLSARDEDADDGLLPDSFRRSPRGPRTSHISDEKHQPGSIVRISVKNFVTYTRATFKCGPSLNMIIGPNGTGKSTLVCAICLGLGSKTSVLGRAKDLADFVKHGHKEAEIEVELAGKEGQTNPVIQHTIKKDGNKSSWRINGRQTTHKEVIALIRSYSIQIENLCQFLPQDRVVEFSSMTPEALLESTLKAAAPEQMSAWHMQLRELGDQRLEMQSKNTDDANTLTNLEKRHAAQQHEVERIRERKALMIRVQGLEMAKPGIQYKEEKGKLDEMKRTKRQYEHEFRDLSEQVAPKLRGVEDQVRHVAELKAVVSDAEGIYRKFAESTERKINLIKDKKTAIDECEADHNSAVQMHKKRTPEIQAIDRQIKALKEQHEQEPVPFDAPAYNLRIREKDTAIRAIKQNAEELKVQEAAIKTRVFQANSERETARSEIQNMQTTAGQQGAKLRGASKDSATAYTWLQKNQNMFTDKIYGPPLIECTIKDPRYVGALESAVSRSDLLCFTATNREDWQKFIDICQNQLKVKDITAKVSGQALNHWKAPVTKEELADYGLDEFAIDLLQGPDPVLSMLCDSSRLHRTGMSLKDISDAQFNRLKDSAMNSWVAGRSSYRVNKRAEYGPDAVSTVVSNVKAARLWTNEAGVDQDALRRLHMKMKDCEGDLAAAEEELEPLREQIQNGKTTCATLEDEKRVITQEKTNAQTAYNFWTAIPRKILTFEEKRAAKQKLQDEVRDELEGIRIKKQNLLLERAQLALDYTIALEKSMQIQEEIAEMEIQKIEAESELEYLEAESLHIRQMLEQRRAQITDYERQIKMKTDECKRLVHKVQECQALMNASEEGAEMKIIHDRWCNDQDLDTGEPLAEDEDPRTLDHLDAELSTTKGRLELLRVGNPRALEQYEERARQIEQLQRKIENFEADLEALSQEIHTIQDQWEPKLEEMVAQISEAFSNNFERIGCAGQVSVRKHENDFKAWAIEIMVKFRENEELAVLDNHRQSGGERAVSTSFYLMSLQTLARAPFRVVDEINQGMDPRNERMVHERMVDIACSENTSQYFLITPKLLNGLKFHERMHVHIILSGGEMPANDGPESEAKLDFAKLAERAQQMGRVH